MKSMSFDFPPGYRRQSFAKASRRLSPRLAASSSLFQQQENPVSFLFCRVEEGEAVAVRAPEAFVILGIQLKLLRCPSCTTPMAG